MQDIEKKQSNFLNGIIDGKPNQENNTAVDKTCTPSIMSEVEKSVSDEKKTRLEVHTALVARMFELKVPKTSYSDVLAVLLGIARLGRKTMTVHLSPYPRDVVAEATAWQRGPCAWCWETVDHLTVLRFYGHVGTEDALVCDTCIKILKRIMDVKEPGGQYPMLGVGVGTDPPDRPGNQS